jgi:hypothetical protein
LQQQPLENRSFAARRAKNCKSLCKTNRVLQQALQFCKRSITKFDLFRKLVEIIRKKGMLMDIKRAAALINEQQQQPRRAAGSGKFMRKLPL